MWKSPKYSQKLIKLMKKIFISSKQTWWVLMKFSEKISLMKILTL